VTELAQKQFYGEAGVFPDPVFFYTPKPDPNCRECGGSSGYRCVEVDDEDGILAAVASYDCPCQDRSELALYLEDQRADYHAKQRWLDAALAITT